MNIFSVTEMWTHFVRGESVSASERRKEEAEPMFRLRKEMRTGPS